MQIKLRRGMTTELAYLRQVG